MESHTRDNGEKTAEDSKAVISTFLFVIAGVPLLLYPFVLIANVMSLAAEPTGQPAPLVLTIICYAFLAASSSYPATYIVSLIIYRQRKRLLYAFAPLVHIAVVVLLHLLWGAVEKG